MRWLVFLAPLLNAASPQPSVDQAPAILTPYIRDGSFDPGDYRWLRGAFDGASAADKAANSEIMTWRQRCRTRDLEHARIDLAAMGIRSGVALDSIPYQTLLCGQVASLPEHLNLHDWDSFVRDVKTVQPIAQAFLAAVRFSEIAAKARTSALSDLLKERVVGEQALRQGLDWASGGTTDTDSLSLTPQQRGILLSQIVIAMNRRDHANTEWLKGIVGLQGWPKRSEVGEAGSDVAWLFVQHADANPAFQAQILRLLEPLVPAQEVSPKRYAYLYDRLMLKLTGKQRYATQLVCRAGQYVPQPLEKYEGIDTVRRGVGLDALADYEKLVAKDMGSCEGVAGNN
jgi:hypothetical protein